VVAVQVGIMAMGVVDTVMVGHLSATALAAVALGNLYFFGCAILGMGALMGLDPVVAQAVGAGDHPAVARGVQRGLILAIISVPAAIILLYAEPVLRALTACGGRVAAGAYARRAAPSVLPPISWCCGKPAGVVGQRPILIHSRRQRHQRLLQLR
jgi:MATE family multidrug resistance protein